MLAFFDTAKMELKRIRKELTSELNKHGHHFLGTPQGQLLAGRARDLLERIYADSPNLLNEVKNQLNARDPGLLLLVIEDALAVGPPMRRAIEQEADRQFVQGLVDATLLRSRLVWGGAIAVIALAGFGLTFIGFGVEQLNSYADEARRLVESAKDDFEDQRREIALVTDDATTMLEEAKALEVNLAQRRDQILQKLSDLEEQFANPDSRYSLVVTRAENQLNAWEREREEWDARLADHQSYFERETGKARVVFDGHQGSVNTAATNALEFINGERSRVTQAASTADAELAVASETRKNFDMLLAESTTSAQDRAKEFENIVRQGGEKLVQIQTTALEALSEKNGFLEEIEALKSEALELDGAVQRVNVRLAGANEIIDVVEDKRSSIAEKVEQLFAMPVTLNLATAIRAVLSDSILMVLSFANALSLFLVLIVTSFYFELPQRMRRLFRRQGKVEQVVGEEIGSS